jgi:hypothetical protein
LRTVRFRRPWPSRPRRPNRSRPPQKTDRGHRMARRGRQP